MNILPTFDRSPRSSLSLPSPPSRPTSRPQSPSLFSSHTSNSHPQSQNALITPPTRPQPTPLASLRTRSSSAASTTANSWLSNLAVGLSWIENQSGNVVQSQAVTGLGGTIREGLSNVGGLGKRQIGLPLGLNGVLGGGRNGNGNGEGSGYLGSENSDAASDAGGSYTTQGTGPAGAAGGQTNGSWISQSGANFLGKIRQSSSSPLPPFQQSQAQTARSVSSPSPPPSLLPPPSQPGNMGRLSFSSNGSGTAAASSNLAGPSVTRPQTLTSSISSPPSLIPNPNSSSISNPTSTSTPAPNPAIGRPTVTRLGPPRPANFSRLRHSPENANAMTDAGPQAQSSGSGSGGGTGQGHRSSVSLSQGDGRRGRSSLSGVSSGSGVGVEAISTGDGGFAGGGMRGSTSLRSLHEHSVLPSASTTTSAAGSGSAIPKNLLSESGYAGGGGGMTRSASGPVTLGQLQSNAGGSGRRSEGLSTVPPPLIPTRGSSNLFPSSYGSQPLPPPQIIHSMPTTPIPSSLTYFTQTQSQAQPSTSAAALKPPSFLVDTAPRISQRAYKPGFQPNGVKASRTVEFEEMRRRGRDERGREEGRLGRRWGKLVDLHFNPTLGVNGVTSASGEGTSSGSSTPPKLPRSTSTSSTLIPDLDLKRRIPNLSISSVNNKVNDIASTFDNVKAKDVWRGFRSVTGVGVEGVEAEKKREVERGLVRWEPDGEIHLFPHEPETPLPPLRPHHLFPPPTSTTILNLASATQQASTTSDPSAIPIDPAERNLNPSTGLPIGTRREKCSLLLVADWRTGKGEEVDEGFVGWMKMEPPRARGGKTGSGGGGGGEEGEGEKGMGKQPNEVQVKGVRVCRECWKTVSRKQVMVERQEVTRFTRFYEALKASEADIMDILPEFQDILQELDVETFPPPPIDQSVISLQKHLIALFAEYDAFAKKIRAFPCESGSAQERVQMAIARQGAMFVAKEATVLQLLPKLQKRRHKRATSSIASGDSTPLASDAGSSIMAPTFSAKMTDDETAMVIQPLLEQEAQIEIFIKEANAQRKFDDARTLQTSLDEIRAEIARLASG